MPLLAVAAVPAAAIAWISARSLGEATLIAIGAFVLGYVVSLLWPKAHHPQVFGTLAAVAVVGALAYMGSAGAAIALVVLVGLAALMAVAGVMW